MSTMVPSKKEDAAANAGFRTAPAPSNANPPSTIFLRVHGIGNIPLKAKQRSLSKSDFSFATTENSSALKDRDRVAGLLDKFCSDGCSEKDDAAPETPGPLARQIAVSAPVV
ncbi:hypothetical protein [Rhizobium ruizarguesonis]|uniref:hypothetical protein n=1 Tax=Rhizobium ruizarguesonis TaxID=2081791 RepID=UPI001CF1E0B7|nr:hypothetical protein [Rhizobium ruizarguesonis]MCB2401310.1 hypothetical protein [Rhizobium ruizarguesonis]